MPILSRMYHHKDDFNAVMNYLRDTYLTIKSLQNWLPTRFENISREHEKDIRIWIDASSEQQKTTVLAIANSETSFRYFIQIHPDYSFLIDEILQWIEEYNISRKSEQNKKQTLSVVSLEGNSTREAALQKHGFEKGEIYGILRLRDLNTIIPDFNIPDGFKIRSVNPDTDFEELTKAVRTVFNHGEWFNKEVLEGISHASFYFNDLDLVAVDKKGKIVSFCTFRLDLPSGITELEPMGTLPDYRQQGLAKAILCEGFKRIKKYEPKLLYIDGAANTPAANRLYEATGFTKKKNYYFWNKII
jgi:predicted N-acetyltransferase YhbS